MDKNDLSDEELQFEVSRLVDNVEGELTPEEEERIRTLIIINPKAYEYFIEQTAFEEFSRRAEKVRRQIIEVVEDAAMIGNLLKNRIKNPELLEYLKKFRRK